MTEYSQKWIEDKLNLLTKVYVYPGEDELELWLEGGLRVLRGRIS